MKKKRILLSILFALVILLILWFSGLLPKQVAKLAANNYMSNQEDSEGYEFEKIEYSSAHDSYFVSYVLNNNEEDTRSLEIPDKYFPFGGVFKDSRDWLD